MVWVGRLELFVPLPFWHQVLPFIQKMQMLIRKRVQIIVPWMMVKFERRLKIYIYKYHFLLFLFEKTKETCIIRRTESKDIRSLKSRHATLSIITNMPLILSKRIQRKCIVLSIVNWKQNYNRKKIVLFSSFLAIKFLLFVEAKTAFIFISLTFQI